MSKQTRKRKSVKPVSSNLMDPTDMDLLPPKEKVRVREEVHHGMDDFSQLLFGNTQAFLSSLEEAEKEVAAPDSQDYLDHVDSGIDSGTSEDSDSSENRKPAWFDEDDAGIDVGEALKVQQRRLPSGAVNDSGNKYSNLLKHKFQSMVGTPNWAKLKKHNKGTEEEILRSAGFIAKSPQTFLPAGSLEFKKVKDLNSETFNEGPFINAIEFHPSSSVGLVAGNKGIATIFAVDGKKNNKLHSIGFERFPIMCAKFVKNGDEAILGSRQGYIYSYDLLAAKAIHYNLPPNVTQCKNFVVSPDNQFFAVQGKWGEVHIFSANSKEKIATLKQNNEVTALEYSPNGILFGHSDCGEVTIWDVNMRKVKHTFVDEGCLQGSAISVSSSNQFLACGSAQGVVNIYGMEDVIKNKLPKPKKTIMNLTTAIGSLKFNSSSEILALASPDIKNSVKLFHISSGTVFSNFPPFQSKLGHLNSINFTPGSGFLALGNRKSVVSLFRLKHFKNY